MYGTSPSFAACRNGVEPMRLRMLRAPSLGSRRHPGVRVRALLQQLLRELEAVDLPGRHRPAAARAESAAAGSRRAGAAASSPGRRCSGSAPRSSSSAASSKCALMIARRSALVPAVPVPRPRRPVLKTCSKRAARRRPAAAAAAPPARPPPRPRRRPAAIAAAGALNRLVRRRRRVRAARAPPRCCPARTANSSGVNPPFERALTSAPASTSARDDVGVVLGRRPHQRASGRASCSFAFTSAPCASSSLTAVDVAGPRGRHQRRLAFGQRRVRHRRPPRAAAR